MSVEAMAIVLHHARATGTAKLVLLGIANHEGDGGAWPSVATLAKYAGLTGKPENNAKTVRRILRALELDGEVVTLRQEGGNRDTPTYLRTNLYRVTVRCPKDCDGTTQHRTPRESSGSVPGGFRNTEDPRATQPGGRGPGDPGGGGHTARGEGATQPPKPSGEPPFESPFESSGGSKPQAQSSLPVDEPPRRCPRHINNAQPPACGACADARRAHDAWSKAQRDQPTPTPSRPECPIHPGQPTGSQQCPDCVRESTQPRSFRDLVNAHRPAAKRGAA